MSEPVDIAAEIRAYALEGCPTTDTFNEWADHMERLQAELEKERRLHGMARSTISSRTDEVERLQADQTILLATAQDALECLVDWASYADEYFLVKHDFKGDVQRISSVTDRFRRTPQTGDSNEPNDAS